MLSFLTLLAGTAALGGAMAWPDRSDEEAAPPTGTEGASDGADAIVITDIQVVFTEDDDMAMNKGELINKVQEGAGLKALEGAAHDADVIGVWDQIMQKTDDDGTDEPPEEDADGYIIIEEIFVGKLGDDLGDFDDILAMNKGDLINKVQESAGLAFAGTEEDDPDTSGFVITDVDQIRSEPYDDEWLSDVWNKMDYDSIDGAPDERVGSDDGGNTHLDVAELAAMVMPGDNVTLEISAMNKGDLVTKVAEGAGLSKASSGISDFSDTLDAFNGRGIADNDPKVD